jgi:hypothetical protein
MVYGEGRVDVMVGEMREAEKRPFEEVEAILEREIRGEERDEEVYMRL